MKREMPIDPVYEFLRRYGEDFDESRKRDGDFVLIAPAAFGTPAIPGSPEKIAVMAQRYRAKQRLHHPNDAELPPGAPTQSSQYECFAPPPPQETLDLVYGKGK